MILPMKHLTVITLDSKRTQATTDLEQLGMVHVTSLATQSPDLDSLKQQDQRIRRALVILGDAVAENPAIPPFDSDNLDVIINDLIAKSDRIKACQDEMDRLNKELARIEPFGEFNPEDLRQLQEKKAGFVLLSVANTDLKQLPAGLPLFLIKRSKTKSSFLADIKQEDIDPRWEQIQIPESSPSAMRQQIDILKKELSDIRGEINKFLGYRSLLERQLQDIEHDMEFAQVEAGMDQNGNLAITQGFIPANSCAAVKEWAQKKQWGILLRDPDPESPVPTILKNPAPVAILKPVLDFLGTLPGYRERDISPWFLFFLVIFFSMIIGDAAYGCIFLAASIAGAVAQKSKGKPVHPALKLLMVFSIATIAWGGMTGSWFALDGAMQVPLLKALTIPALTNPETSKTTVLLICFILGLIHLNLAHLLRFFNDVRNAPHIHAIAQLGWAMVINGAFFLVLNVVVDPVKFPVPAFALWFIVGGMAAVFIFEKQEGDNFFKGILRSLANIITTSLSGVSAFADIISYVRLFAVGLAGVAIEQSFNAMALPLLSQGGFAVAGGIMIMFFGHSLNLVMGALSVIVHGIRLNILEFSSHTGLEWAGFPYKPFKKSN